MFRITIILIGLVAFNSYSFSLIGYSDNNEHSKEIELFADYVRKKKARLAYELNNSILYSVDINNDLDYYLDHIVKLSSFYYYQGSFDSSYFLAKLADSLIGVKDPNVIELSGRSCYVLALNYYQSQNWKEAQTYFNKSFEIGKLTNNDSLEALSLKSLGNIQFIFNNYSNSLDYYKRSLIVLNKNRIPRSTVLPSVYQNIGISYSMLNQNDSALKYMRKSILLKEAYLGSNDPMLASGYLNISRLLQLNGELNGALKFIDLAERIYISKNAEIDHVLGPLYFNKGSILLTLNDFEEALHYHELALEHYKLNYAAQLDIFPQLYLNFGVIYSNLDRIEDAIIFYQLCLVGEISYEQQVKGNLFLGLAYMKQEKYLVANEKFLLAIDLAEKNLGLENLQTGNLYLNYGIFCEQINEFDLAIEYFNKAARIYQEIFGNKNRDLSNTYTLVGNYFLNVGEPKKALNYFQKALIAFIEDYNEVDNYKNPPSSDLDVDLNLFYTLSGKAKAFYLTYDNHSNDVRDLKASLETAIIAIDLLERIKSTLQGENTKLLVNSRASEIYNIAVLVASELYNLTGEYIYLESAFKYSEKSKGAILLSSLKEMEALQIGNLPEGIKEEEKHLKKAIAQYQNIIYEENQKSPLDSNKVSRLRNRLFESKLKYDSLVASIEANYPEYYNLKYNFDVISITDVQRNLENGQALIEYKLTDSTLFTFIISEDSAAVIGKNVGTSFTDKINKYLDLINRLPKTDSVSDRSLKFAKLGFELTNVLELNNPLIKNCEKLIVVPDDVLGYLSFDALVSDMPELGNSRYNKLNYLIYRHTLSYGYSGSLFFNREDKKPRRSNVLAIAPSYNNIDSSKQLADNNGINRNLEKYLIPLPFTSDEVNAVVKIFKGTQQVGVNATETGFKASAADYSILHFAMHTLINDEDPLASKLVFSLNNDTLNDGFLNTYEIYNLELNAELAVLSACQTGAGKLSKGEGIMSLARGFLFAGVPGIIMTLWAVEDVSGAEIVTSFYEYLYDGQNKDVALRKAKLAYLENADQLRAHPYFWAAYVQIGDNGPVSSKTNTNIYYFIAGAILLGFVILLSVRKFRR